MRGVSWFLGLFFLATAVSLLARGNDGFALFVLDPWRVEVSLNLLLFLLVAGFLVGYALVRGVGLTLGLPARARAYRAQKQREQVAQVLEEAIRLLFEGRFGHALRRAESAYGQGHAPGTAALIGARAAQRLREPEKLRFWLQQAVQAAPGTEAAALMLEAEMAVEMRDFGAALDALARLQQKHGRHIAALRLELRARQGTGDVAEVLKLVRQLEKRGGLQPDAAREIRQRTHQEAIRQLQGDRGQLLDYLNRLPEPERDPRLLRVAVERLHALDEGGAAAGLVEEALGQGEDEHWSSELAGLYGQLGGEDLNGRIARAEAWLLRQPRDARLLLSLGRLCERQRLWGKARSYLEASLAVGEGRAAHLALARLLDGLGDTDAANLHFRRAAELDAA